MDPVKIFVPIQRVATNALVRPWLAPFWTRMVTLVKAPMAATTTMEVARTNASIVTVKYFVYVLRALIWPRIGKRVETKTNA